MAFNSKVFIYPAGNNENQYINIQEKAIKAAGIDVTYSLKDFFLTKYFLLNWFETLGGNKRIDYFKKCVKIIFLQIFKKKILWVVHNKKPHSKYANDISNKLSIKLMKKLLKRSYRIIILCDETKKVLKDLSKNKSQFENKIYKIPHPNYIDIYPVEETKEIVNDTGKLNFLYIGQVNKYKNIELIIEEFNNLRNENISVHIAGNCKDEVYKKQLQLLSKNNSITFDFRFIPDNEINNLVRKYDILILPYSLETSLNSGTIFLAFNNKKTVISPLIGTLKEFKTSSFFYSYIYKNENEHRLNLLKTIETVINDYESNSLILKEKGEIAFKYVQENNSIEHITQLYKKIFKL